jgi:hypothetical protein
MEKPSYKKREETKNKSKRVERSVGELTPNGGPMGTRIDVSNSQTDSVHEVW